MPAAARGSASASWPSKSGVRSTRSLGSEKRLQLRGLVGAHVGHILPQLQPPLIVGVLGHRCQRVLPSCQDPGLRVAADQAATRWGASSRVMVLPKLSVKLTELPISPSADAGDTALPPGAAQAQRDSRQSAVTRDMDRFIIIWDFLSFQKPGSGAPDRMTGPILPQDLPGCHKNLFFPRPERTFLPHAPGMRVRLPQCCAPAAAWSRGRALSLSFRSGYESDGPGAHTGSRGRAISWAIFSLAAPSRGRKGARQKPQSTPRRVQPYFMALKMPSFTVSSTRRLMACCQR